MKIQHLVRQLAGGAVSVHIIGTNNISDVSTVYVDTESERAVTWLLP